jgi:hypothetical protein
MDGYRKYLNHVHEHRGFHLPANIVAQLFDDAQQPAFPLDW